MDQLPSWHERNRERVLAYKRARYQANRVRLLREQRERRANRTPEQQARAAENARRHRRDHPIDARLRYARDADKYAKRQFGITEKLDWQNLPTDGPCVYCGRDDETVTWDHVIPLGQGGSNTAANCTRCCLDCNRKKQNRTPEQWHDPGRTDRIAERRRETQRRLHEVNRERYNANRRRKRQQDRLASS